jgi:hypothetical protein
MATIDCNRSMMQLLTATTGCTGNSPIRSKRTIAASCSATDTPPTRTLLKQAAKGSCSPSAGRICDAGSSTSPRTAPLRSQAKHLSASRRSMRSRRRSEDKADLGWPCRQLQSERSAEDHDGPPARRLSAFSLRLAQPHSRGPAPSVLIDEHNTRGF